MKKLLVVTHDAGGAELISSYLKHNQLKFDYFLKGPALPIFKRKFKKNFQNFKFSQLKKKILKSDSVLTGTSWESDLEKKVLVMCNENKIKTSSYIDHWVNYTDRFKLNNKKILPDEIWVHDKFSYKIASKKFNIPVKQKKNFFLREILARYKKIKTKKTNFSYDFLFLSEPIKKHFPNLSYSEYSCFKKFIKMIKKKNIYFEKILLRLHPSEKKQKYKKFLDQKEFSKIKSKIYFSSNKELIKDFRISKKIIGINSMALVIGVILKKQVYSCLNTRSTFFKLPYSEIKSITSI